jgi:hypothetical protein
MGSRFARVAENRKATLHRGWGAKALNFCVLFNPEIACSNSGTTPATTITSEIQPEELNLSQGLTGALVDRIVVHKTIEASRTGEDALERMRKGKLTAEERIQRKEKHMTSGLLVSANHIYLSSEVRDYVVGKESAERERENSSGAIQETKKQEMLARCQATCNR